MGAKPTLNSEITNNQQSVISKPFAEKAFVIQILNQDFINIRNINELTQYKIQKNSCKSSRRYKKPLHVMKPVTKN